MPNRRNKLHLGRQVRILGREMQERPKATATIKTAAFVGKHEHDFPLKDTVVDQAAADARNVLVALHLLELATEQESG
jgi:hypothetical protein